MTVKEYREKHRRCRYCVYKRDVIPFGTYCIAKEKCLWFDMAKICRLYEPKALKGGAE